MTKQQIKDYAKVQPVELLKMWIDEGNPDSVPDERLEELSFNCAISDIDCLLDNINAELQFTYDSDRRKELFATRRKAEWFLNKYNA